MPRRTFDRKERLSSGIQPTPVPGGRPWPASRGADEIEADEIADAVMSSQTVSAPVRPLSGDAPSISAGDARLLGRALEEGGRVDPCVASAFERSTGTDVSQARVHQGSSSSDLARALGAFALTRGRDVVIDRDSCPDETTARHLQFHELAHVAQQGKARTSPQVQLRGGRRPARTVRLPRIPMGRAAAGLLNSRPEGLKPTYVPNPGPAELARIARDLDRQTGLAGTAGEAGNLAQAVGSAPGLMLLRRFDVPYVVKDEIWVNRGGALGKILIRAIASLDLDELNGLPPELIPATAVIQLTKCTREWTVSLPKGTYPIYVLRLYDDVPAVPLAVSTEAELLKPLAESPELKEGHLIKIEEFGTIDGVVPWESGNDEGPAFRRP